MAPRRELAWAAGFLEAEGCFSGANGQPLQIQVPQVQRWPLEKLVSILGGQLSYSVQSPKRRRQQSIWRWYVAGPRAAGIMMMLWVFLSPKRKREIVGALDIWKQKQFRISKSSIHCRRGHEFTSENTRIRRRGRSISRICRTCERQESQARWINIKLMSRSTAVSVGYNKR